MTQTSDWLCVDDIFEINEDEVLTLLYKAINLLELYDIQTSMKFEKEVITQSIHRFQDEIIALQGSKTYLSEEQCEIIMEKVYRMIKNVIDLVEIDLFD